MLAKFKKELDRDGELYLRLKARPGASQTAIRAMLDETIKLDVAAPAQKGKANQEIIRFLAKEFAVNKNSVKIIAGAGEPIKLIKLVKYE